MVESTLASLVAVYYWLERWCVGRAVLATSPVTTSTSPRERRRPKDRCACSMFRRCWWSATACAPERWRRPGTRGRPSACADTLGLSKSYSRPRCCPTPTPTSRRIVCGENRVTAEETARRSSAALRTEVLEQLLGERGLIDQAVELVGAHIERAPRALIAYARKNAWTRRWPDFPWTTPAGLARPAHSRNQSTIVTTPVGASSASTVSSAARSMCTRGSAGKAPSL